MSHQQPGWGPHQGPPVQQQSWPQQGQQQGQQGWQQQPGQQQPGQQQWGPGHAAPPPQMGFQPMIPPPRSSGVSVGRIIAGVILIPVIIVSFLYVYGATRSQSGKPSEVFGKAVENAAAATRSPQVIADEDIVVSASNARVLSFSLRGEAPVKLTVQGKADTAKGFNVFVVQASELEKVKANKGFSYVRPLSGERTAAFDRTATLQAGEWAIVVQNSENLLKNMTVHVKLVVDPEE